MNRTNAIRALAALLVVLVGVWIARHTNFEDVTETLPLKGEAETDATYALKQLMHHLDVPLQTVHSLEAPPRHAVLLAGGAERDFARHSLDQLEPWVRAGGHLVVSAAEVWRPPFQKWTGIGLPRKKATPAPSTAAASAPPAKQSDDEAEDDDDDADDTQVPARVRAQIADPKACEPVEMHRGERTDALSLCGGFYLGLTSQATPTWRVSSGERTIALTVPVGRGRVTVLPMSSLYDNRNLARDDNARILLAAFELKHGEPLYVYDATEAESLARLLWRLAAPGLVLLGVAIVLLLVRQLPRFGTPVPAPQPLRRSLAEQIRATAALAWRTRRLQSLRRAVNRALEEAARREIAAFRLLDSRRRAEVLARATGMDAAQLRAAMTEAAGAEAEVQRQAIMTLITTRRRFMQRPPTQGPL